MTETAHTPLPWRAGDCEIFGADDSVVCTVHWRSGDDCHQANLETIVQAVNSHHRLIEALRECGQAIEVLFETADDRVTGVSCIALDMLKDAAKNARAALKEAGRG